MQAASSGDFDLDMDDLRRLILVMERHVMNLQLALPVLHNSVVGTCRQGLAVGLRNYER
jgi:hypothetical protein